MGKPDVVDDPLTVHSTKNNDYCRKEIFTTNFTEALTCDHSSCTPVEYQVQKPLPLLTKNSSKTIVHPKIINAQTPSKTNKHLVLDKKLEENTEQMVSIPLNEETTTDAHLTLTQDKYWKLILTFFFSQR